MKTNLFFLIFMCISSILQAQQPRSWYFGLNMQAQKYWLYNYNDFNNEWLLPVAPKALVPNALSGGISFGRGFKKHFAFQADIQYSSQTQKFFYSVPNNFPDVDVIIRINYFKMPLMFQYNHLKWAKKTAGFYAEVGLQTSIMSNYKQSVNTISGSYISWQAIYEPQQVLFEQQSPWYDMNVFPMENLFKNIQFGSILGFGFKKIINEEYLLQAGFRFDYDFTNTDNVTQGKDIFRSNLRYVLNSSAKTGEKRVNSHNIRAGLNFSISYFLNN